MTGSPHVVLRRYGWDVAWAADWAEAAAGEGVRPGRVVRVERISAQVATDLGIETATWTTPAAHAAGVVAPPAAGDWVGVRDDATPDDPEAIVCVLPRDTVIVRHDPGETAPQVLAANMDLVFVVHGLDRPLNEARLERMLVIAWDSGAEPRIVLTKADLAAAHGVVSVRGELAEIAPAVDVMATSSVEEHGIDELAAVLGTRTAVLLGESGSGKSALVNALAGSDVQTTGAVREGDAKGRHTTTARDLVPVASGGCLIDTPGLRGIGIWHAEEGLVGAFPEIASAGERCRFRDCRHTGEPDCAVQAAVAAGRIGPRRYESWRRLRDEMDDVASRRTMQARKRR
ncbi:MAG: ribosome small subunit-dependent GTPase A [Acidimicrobiia bacterium]|nr:ribosome small subunit-dependent GTPase A [Acidimicrobiia bacterium]